ncbi:MAG: haloacid dehalogenase [Pseudomonadaceae bacterium]|nr:haloacid dehalogenase [Pseudomonadaceae bacterium]HCP55171.1 haloacid dehalogenase [Pseudomonas sp.]
MKHHQFPFKNPEQSDPLGRQPSPNDPLPSWRDGATKQAIVAFVESVTDSTSKDYVPLSERIATLDNDGTLWSEKPLYFQVLFAFDEVKRRASDHPDWKDRHGFKELLEGGIDAVKENDHEGIMAIVEATHTGVSTDQFTANVKAWLATARHPGTHRPYTEMVFQPMLELLDYLRANEFKTYIVSGGEVTFMRAWSEDVYGIGPEQVIGTTFINRYHDNNGEPEIVRTVIMAHHNDGPGKPVGIESIIGRRPIMAIGNGDGDLEMLQWTAAGEGPRFMGVIHHTDAKREWAYDRKALIGKLDETLDEAIANNWTVVDMQRDWARIYPENSDK